MALQALFIYHLAISFLAALVIARRLKRWGNLAIVDYNLLLLFLSVFYLSLSFVFRYTTGYSMLDYNAQSLLQSGVISAVFMTVYLMGYWLKPNNYLTNSRLEIPKFDGEFLCKSIVTLGFCAGLFVLVTHGPGLLSLKNRPEKFEYFMKHIFDPYRITILFNVTLIYSVVLAYTKKSLRWFLFLLPFIILEILAGNRNFMFQSLLAAYVCYALLYHGRFYFLYACGAFVFLASFSMFRESFKMANAFMGLVYSFAEFINTRETQEIALRSGVSYDVLEYILFSFMTILPSSFYHHFNGDAFKTAIALIEGLKNSSALNFGMGSSIVTDAIFLTNKNLVLVVFYPVLHVVFGYFMNYLQRMGGIIGLLIFMYSVGFLFLTMRYGFFTTIFLPFYVILFYGMPLIVILTYSYVKRMAYCDAKQER